MDDLDSRLNQAWDELAEQVAELARSEGIRDGAGLVARLNHPELHRALRRCERASEGFVDSEVVRDFVAATEADGVGPPGRSVLAVRTDERRGRRKR
ncbi:MAG TPA: hypothetical protein RMG48_19865 [Myxococcales bacterium LLY-WYZ-16_1]|nr:hypothetical protein [Myxococcales bacterium LLY-WYZ-16_1]